MQQRGRRVLLNTGHGVNDVYWYILPAILPIIVTQFGLKYGTAGGILTAYLGSAAIFSFLIGKLSDSVSRQRVLGIGFLVASASLILAGFMGRIGPFIIFLLIASIGVSSYHPVAYATIAETTEYVAKILQPWTAFNLNHNAIIPAIVRMPIVITRVKCIFPLQVVISPPSSSGKKKATSTPKNELIINRAGPIIDPPPSFIPSCNPR